LEKSDKAMMGVYLPLLSQNGVAEKHSQNLVDSDGCLYCQMMAIVSLSVIEGCCAVPYLLMNFVYLSGLTGSGKLFIKI
jgi:hypothetical protein